MVSASGSETSVSSSMPTSAIIYDAYTSIIIKDLRLTGFDALCRWLDVRDENSFMFIEIH